MYKTKRTVDRYTRRLYAAAGNGSEGNAAFCINAVVSISYNALKRVFFFFFFYIHIHVRTEKVRVSVVDTYNSTFFIRRVGGGDGRTYRAVN